ncbi:MAG: PA2169 family four-helix-bundle protein [Phycisphaerales bacterium]
MPTTNTLDSKTISGLQDLIQLNIDSDEGFNAAADQLDASSRLAMHFRECAAERRSFASELQAVVGANSERPEQSGTAKGTLHRWWLEIRGAVQDGDEHAVLAEAERGEDAIKRRYEKVLKETAGSPVNDLLQRQYAAVKRRHDQVRDMRDAKAKH